MEDIWTEHIIRCPDGTSGSSVAEAIAVVAEAMHAEVIVIRGVDGSGISNLIDLQPTGVQEFVRLCRSVLQFDWADIYFFKGSDVTSVPDIRNSVSYPAAIKCSLATMRIVDDEYLFIYVRQPDAPMIRQAFTSLMEWRDGCLTDFVFAT